jgi:1,4-alpha-glucan branching enzyme
VTVIVGDERHPMRQVHDDGGFEATVPGTVLDYRLDVDGEVVDDPYRHPPTLGELDLHLIGEGRHERLWDVLGAHVRPGGASGSPRGVAFAVWAPNARGVRMVGDCTGWGVDDGWPMRSLGGSGVWELFVPGVAVGERYKFRILGRDGVWREKADPMARQTEAPPRTASVVTESHYEWKDAEWMAQRARAQHHKEPVSIYEVHLGSWRPGLSYV